MPEKWGATIYDKGFFSTEGIPPIIADERVSFVKGWFQQTLPLFLKDFSSTKQIIIHCDADLYSSTLYVLCKLDPIIKTGTIVIFDEFSSIMDEFRALDDFSQGFNRSYEVIGAAGKFYEHVALRFV